MWQRAIHHLYARPVYAYSMSRVNSTGRLPMPTDAPLVHAPGPDPDRILFLGGFAVRGIGVASYDLSLGGSLGRQLARATGRGVDVDVRGSSRFTAARCVEALQQTDLREFDAVVLQVGALELLGFRPVAAWAEDVREVVAAAVEAVTPGTPVVVLGSLPLATVMNTPPPIRAAMTRRADRMDAVTRRACDDARSVYFVELTPDTTGSPIGDETGRVYREWAEDIVPTLAAVLCGARARAAADVDEAARQRALDDMHLTRDPDPRIERVVRMARDSLGVATAMLTVIDRDDQWVKAAVPDAVPDAKRVDAFCDVTIRTPGVYVVEDVAADPAFADRSWAGADDAPGFYAGYPLEAPGGQRIGALCVLDPAPRPFTRDDETMLRSLALRAQSLLWDSAGR